MVSMPVLIRFKRCFTIAQWADCAYSVNVCSYKPSYASSVVFISSFLQVILFIRKFSTSMPCGRVPIVSMSVLISFKRHFHLRTYVRIFCMMREYRSSHGVSDTLRLCAGSRPKHSRSCWVTKPTYQRQNESAAGIQPLDSQFSDTQVAYVRTYIRTYVRRTVAHAHCLGLIWQTHRRAGRRLPPA